MFDFKHLTRRYQNEAGFNKMVNLFTQLIKEHGFLPSEIREGLFLAQYNFEMNNSESLIRTQDEWRKLQELHEILQEKFGASE